MPGWPQRYAMLFSLVSCTPQKRHGISRGSFFQPIFMVQPAENILGPDPGGCWQLMPLKFRSREWFPTEIGNAWPQAGVWSSVIVVGNPLLYSAKKAMESHAAISSSQYSWCSPSVITAKAANDYHFKTGQRE